MFDRATEFKIADVSFKFSKIGLIHHVDRYRKIPQTFLRFGEV